MLGDTQNRFSLTRLASGTGRSPEKHCLTTTLRTKLLHHIAIAAACLGDGVPKLPQINAAEPAALTSGGVAPHSTDVVTVSTNIPDVALRPTQFKSAQEALAFYRSYILPATRNTVPLDWTGSIEDVVAGRGVMAGTISEAHLKQIQTYVNALRAIAGVPGNVVFYDRYNAPAQQAALVLAQSGLSHTLSPNSPGYTPEAAKAAGLSAICDRTTPASIASLMGDHDTPSVGHREAILRASNMAMGLGTVPSSRLSPWYGATAIYFLATEPYNPNVTPRDFFEFNTVAGSNLENNDGAELPKGNAKGFHAIAWPPKGYVPVFVVPWGYLSMFGAPGNIDFSQAKVQMSWTDPWGDTTKGIMTAEAPIAFTSADRVVWKLPTGCGFSFSDVESSWKIVIRDIRKFSDDFRSGPYELSSVAYTVTGCSVPRDAEGNWDSYTLSTIEKIRYDRHVGTFLIEATLTPGHQYQVQFSEGDLDNPDVWFNYGSIFTATASSHEIGGTKASSKLWLRLVDKTQEQH